VDEKEEEACEGDGDNGASIDRSGEALPPK
jgi:hypothetical protein